MKTNKPQASIAQAREYNELKNKMNCLDPSWTDEESNAVLERMNELEEEYDWFNTEFVDPVTGKKGMKDVTGKVVAPALYDDFVEYQSYLGIPNAPVIAVIDGKCGIVAGDGSGKVLCEFKYDVIGTLPFTTLYWARWNGEEKYFGVIAVNGDIVCPNILTSYSEIMNGIVAIHRDGKHGVIDVTTYQCVLPKYDEVEVDTEGPVIFYKDGQKGYVTEENGEFVEVEQYENDEKYENFTPISTFL